jgi:hypothetical protein
MGQDACPECSKLIQEYRTALMEYIRVHEKLRRGLLSHSVEAMEKSSDELVAADSARSERRKALVEHQKSAHPDGTS